MSDIYAKVLHGIGDLGVGLEHPQSPYYDRTLQPYRFDPAHARTLLDQAGWRVGPDGTRSKDGKPLRIVFSTVTGVIDREQTQLLLQSRWHDLGVDAQLKNYPPSTFFAPAATGGIVYGGKFDVALFAFFMRTTDPERVSFDGSNEIPPAGQNQAFWRNARVDALEAQGSALYDEIARRPIYDRIQRIVAADAPYLTMRWWKIIAMHDVRLRGLRPAPIGSTYWNVRDWTF